MHEAKPNTEVLSQPIWKSREEVALNEGRLFPDVADLRLPELVQRFLRARSLIGEREVRSLFSAKMQELSDPYLMMGMDQAVVRLVQAFTEKQPVCIYADFDLDGTSGLALLYEGLKTLGFPNLSYYQPKRLSEGYGFHAHAVDELAQKGVKLVVTVDVGITAIPAVDRARELGVDVIITDHHQPAAILPKAFAIVNPNQVGDTSGLGYLCGAGVAFYLLRAVKRALVQQSLVTENILDLRVLLDFFTIGTLTDMVPLVGDNRILVKHGLVQLEKTKRAGLRELLLSLGLEGRSLTAQDVAIRFAPKLNALSRLENGLLPVDLFLAKDTEYAREMVTTVLANNDDRVSLQQQGEREAQLLLQDWPHRDFVFVTSNKFHRGIVGLIATKLAQQWNCPAFVGAEAVEGESDGVQPDVMVVGSARTTGKYGASVLQALQSAGGALNRFGGHHAASGFEFSLSKKQQVIDALAEHFKKGESKQEQIVFEYDLTVSQQDIEPGSIRWFDALGPFGQSFEPPLLALRAQTIKSLKVLKGGHWKFQLTDSAVGEGSSLEALMFSPAESQTPPNVGDQIDILGEVQWNYFAGQKRLQFLIRDLHFSGSGLKPGVEF